MNHIQHFGAGAFVALFAVFGMSAIDTNAQYFAIENSNAIYSQSAAVAMAQATKATAGTRAVDAFAPSTRINNQSREAHLRGTVSAVTDKTITVTTDKGEWTVNVSQTTKFPMARGAAVQIKVDATTTPTAPAPVKTDIATTPVAPVAPIAQVNMPVKVGDRVDVIGRVIGAKTIRGLIVNDLDIRVSNNTGEGAKSAPQLAPTVGATSTVKPHDVLRPDPMPQPIAPVRAQIKLPPETAQPVPMPRD